MVKHPKEFFVCKYNESSGFWDTGNRKVSLMFGQYRISTSSSKPPPPNPQNDQNVTVMQQASVCQVHILYRQKQILKCTTELPLEQAFCSCMHQITTKTTAIFCRLVSLYPPDLTKFQNMLKTWTSNTSPICVTWSCLFTQYLNNLKLHTTNIQWRPLVLQEVGATYFTCITHISSALCVSRGQPQIV